MLLFVSENSHTRGNIWKFSVEGLQSCGLCRAAGHPWPEPGSVHLCIPSSGSSSARGPRPRCQTRCGQTDRASVPVHTPLCSNPTAARGGMDMHGCAWTCVGVHGQVTTVNNSKKFERFTKDEKLSLFPLCIIYYIYSI